MAEGFAQRVQNTQRLVAQLDWILDQSEELEKVQIPQLAETEKDLEEFNTHYKEMLESLLAQQKANDQVRKELSAALDAKVLQLQQEREARLKEVNGQLRDLRAEAAAKESELASTRRRLQALQATLARAAQAALLPPAIEQRLIPAFADEAGTMTAASQFMLDGREQMLQLTRALGPPPVGAPGGPPVPWPATLKALPPATVARAAMQVSGHLSYGPGAAQAAGGSDGGDRDRVPALMPPMEGEDGSPTVLALPAPKLPQYPF
eukprot:EG_transcript_19774